MSSVFYYHYIFLRQCNSYTMYLATCHFCSASVVLTHYWTEIIHIVSNAGSYGRQKHESAFYQMPLPVWGTQVLCGGDELQSTSRGIFQFCIFPLLSGIDDCQWRVTIIQAIDSSSPMEIYHIEKECLLKLSSQQLLPPF